MVTSYRVTSTVISTTLYIITNTDTSTVSDAPMATSAYNMAIGSPIVTGAPVATGSHMVTGVPMVTGFPMVTEGASAVTSSSSNTSTVSALFTCSRYRHHLPPLQHNACCEKGMY